MMMLVAIAAEWNYGQRMAILGSVHAVCGGDRRRSDAVGGYNKAATDGRTDARRVAVSSIMHRSHVH